MIGSQGVVLATAMVVSSTVLFLAFSKDKSLFSPPIFKNLDHQSPAQQNLRSCLSSDEKKREKKKVRFAENVKDTKGNGEEYRRAKESYLISKQENEKMRENSIQRIHKFYRNEGIPANRIALYNGILRDRVHRIECAH